MALAGAHLSVGQDDFKSAIASLLDWKFDFGVVIENDADVSDGEAFGVGTGEIHDGVAVRLNVIAQAVIIEHEIIAVIHGEGVG